MLLNPAFWMEGALINNQDAHLASQHPAMMSETTSCVGVMASIPFLFSKYDLLTR
jgi:hypothetical protein